MNSEQEYCDPNFYFYCNYIFFDKNANNLFLDIRLLEKLSIVLIATLKYQM